MSRRFLALSLLLMVAGCATPYTLVEPKRQSVRDTLSVEPGREWNRINYPVVEGGVEIWTLDGSVLNTLMFVAGTADGKPIFVRRAQPGAPEGEKPPVFRGNMTSLDIRELFEDTVALSFKTAIVETSNLKPDQLAGAPGFRFNTRMIGQDEVERLGVALGAVRDGRLYLLWFQGARLNYYERYLPEVERVFASARFIGK